MSEPRGTDWLTGWLRRHPVRELPEQDEPALTESVMRRVRELPTPLAIGHRREPAVSIWWRSMLGWTGGLAVATAAVLIALRMSTSMPTKTQMAADEAPVDDAAWIAQTLELLQSVEGDDAVEALPEAGDDELLDELELLDAAESAESAG